MKKKFRILLAGNPNSGKTTIFNQLTGTRQHVGNYPGVTVERHTGTLKIDDKQIEIIDLPGIYGLSSASPEEKVAFDELTKPGIDLILNVLDSSVPQRSLYLTTQLAELHLPMLLVFNMSDEAKAKGLRFNIPELEKFFGAPIVQTIGSKGNGIGELKQVLGESLDNIAGHQTPKLNYGTDVDDAIEILSAKIDELKLDRFSSHIPSRFFAIKLLENDEVTMKIPEFSSLLPLVQEQITHLNASHAISADTFMADCRHAMIAGACRTAITVSEEKRQEISDKIDAVMTNKYIGLPLFFLVMFAVFWFTFTVADPLMGYIEDFFALLADGVNAIWPEGFLPFLQSLITDGIIGGVGGVLVFLPNIMFLFLAIAFLEDSGYMARAAFVMDGVMRKFGLQGKSFVPLVLGFGCTVPAVMATRSIESEKDRITTIMVLPLMSCGARLPIYALIIPAFFADRYQAVMMWVIYLIGVIIALIGARLLKATLFKGDGEVYIMELPPYRMPTLKSVVLHMWDRSRAYLYKAGTIILFISIILFFLNTYPQKEEFSQDYDGAIEMVEADATLSDQTKENIILNIENEKLAEEMEYTVSGRIGKAMEVVFKPLGFDWKISTATIGALAAKEVFVSQLGILYSVGEADEESVPLREHLINNYTPLQAFCIMIFALLSIPCIATIAIVRRELNWKYALCQAAGLFLLAYTVTLVIYQVGSMLNIGTDKLL